MRPLFGILLVAGVTPFASAQNSFRPLPRVVDVADSAGTELPPLEAEDSPGLDVDLLGVGRVDREGGLEGASGSFAAQRGSWGVELRHDLGENRRIAARALTEFTFYDWNGMTGLVPGQNMPFNDLYRTELSLSVTTDREPGLGYFAGFGVELGGEDDIAGRDSLSVGGAAGVTLTTDSGNTVSIGLAAQSRLEDTPWVWPFLGLDLSLGDDTRVLASGDELRLEHDFAPRWTTFAFADWAIRQHRLNDDGPLANGVFRDEEVRLGVGLRRRLGRAAALELCLGQTLWREFDVLNDGGAQVTEVEAENKPFLCFGLRARL